MNSTIAHHSYVTFCIDDRKFRTSVETLCKFPNSRLAKIATHAEDAEVLKCSRRDEPDMIYLDRDPIAFDTILRYLRTEKLVVPEKDPVSVISILLTEAEWYGIDSLVKVLKTRVQQQSLDMTREQIVWIVARSDRRSFRGLRLAGLDLQNLDLLGANFSRTDLRDANLDHTDGGHSVFMHTNAANCSFRSSSLQFVKFNNSNLKNVDFSDANLFGAWLDGADISGANFHGANLERTSFAGCIGINSANFAGAVNLIKARDLPLAVVERNVDFEQEYGFSIDKVTIDTKSDYLNVPTLQIDGYLSDGAPNE